MNDTALWMRKWNIVIADKKDDKAINVSKLRVVFNVHRSRETDHFATVKIYNLDAETERWIIANGDRLIIEAGYEGYVGATETKDGVTSGNAKQYGKIFDGKIIYPYRSRESNVDYVLSLLVVDGNNALNKNYISKTVGKGLNMRGIVDTACKKSTEELPCSIVSKNLQESKLPRGKVFFGNPMDYIRKVAADNDATWWIEDGKLNIMKYTDGPNGEEALVLTPETGLIGFPQQTQYGCNWQMLLNPAIKMMSLVQLKNSDMNEMASKPGSNMVMPIDDDWIYQVTEVTHVGDTYGSEWYTQCNGISRYGKGSIPALLANNAQNPGGSR